MQRSFQYWQKSQFQIEGCIPIVRIVKMLASMLVNTKMIYTFMSIQKLYYSYLNIFYIKVKNGQRHSICHGEGEIYQFFTLFRTRLFLHSAGFSTFEVKFSKSHEIEALLSIFLYQRHNFQHKFSKMVLFSFNI